MGSNAPSSSGSGSSNSNGIAMQRPPRTTTKIFDLTEVKSLEGFDVLKVIDRPISPCPGQAGSAPPTSRRILGVSDPKKSFLPGQPRIAINDDDVSIKTLHDWLEKVHLTKELDKLLPWMKYIFVQTPSYQHITPLHHQESRERKIVVDEHPGLHLVWYYDRILIKPLPAYIFSAAFWTYLSEHPRSDPKDPKDPTKDPREEIYEAALGFMRSYWFIIQYEIDYVLACEKRLIPKKPDGNFPTYEEFCRFMAPFEHVTDKQCSTRFQYGELRLTRINRTASFFRFKLAYFHIYPQWGAFLEHFLAPIITIFAISSVVLNSMQVSLQAIDMSASPGAGGAVDSDDGGGGGGPPSDHGWPSFVSASKWFPIVVMILIAAVLGIGLLGLCAMAVKDFLWAQKTRRKKDNGEPKFGEKSHGLIW